MAQSQIFSATQAFFRYHEACKIIVLAWINDEDTKRAYQSTDDAYKTFRKMLAAGQPPDDWGELLAEATNG